MLFRSGDGTGKSLGIGAAVALHQDAVQANEQGTVVLARIELGAQRLQGRLGQQVSEPGKDRPAESLAQERGDQPGSALRHLQRHVAREAVGDDHVHGPGADIVALAVASSKSTYHLMDGAAFNATKKGAMFVNVTRGETVDQSALKQALESGQLASAFIDVTEPEPLPKDDPLWTDPNLVISPHAAGGGSTRGGSRIAGVVTENIERLKSGRPFIHLIKI